MSRFESSEKERHISHVLVYLLLYENKLCLWVVDCGCLHESTQDGFSATVQRMSLGARSRVPPQRRSLLG